MRASIPHPQAGLRAFLAILCCTWIGMAARAADPPPSCPPGDLLAGAEVVHVEHVADPARITDGATAPLGERIPSGNASAFVKPTAQIVYALAEPTLIQALWLQADAGDHYHVSLSLDGQRWEYAWQAPVLDAEGLQVRSIAGIGKTARFIRLHDPYGAAPHAVAEFAAYCRLPAAPPEFRELPPAPIATSQPRFTPLPPFRYAIGLTAILAFATMAPSRQRRRLVLGCGALALCLALGRSFGWAVALVAGAMAVLLLPASVRAGRLGESIRRRARVFGLAGLTLAAVLAWFNFLEFHVGTGRFVHVHDVFHHYLGAKYLPELGYSRLYECAWLAEVQDRGPGIARHRTLRDLETYQTHAPRAMADPSLCTSHFTAERWSQFVQDVRFFRGEIAATAWHRLLFMDHGFNGTPLWATLARAFTFSTPLTEARLRWLATLDLVLYAGLFAALAWSFGFTTMVLAVVAWGIAYFPVFDITGGAFLRVPWLFCCVLAMCLLKKGWPLCAGLSLGVAALLALFPVLMALGWLVQLLWNAWRRQSVRVQAWAFAGMALAAVLGGAVGQATGAGVASHRQLFAKLQLHEQSQFATNRGLKALFSHRPANLLVAASDGSLEHGAERFVAVRQETFARRKPLYVATAALLLFAYGWFAARREAWAAVALAPVVVFALVEVSNYYYGMVVLMAPLALLPAWLGPPFLLGAIADLAIDVLSAQPEVAGARQAVSFLALTAILLLTSKRGRLPPDR